MNFDKYITSNLSEFKEKLSSVAERLGVTPNQLLSVMFIESNINPKALNSYTNAVGLIQFMPSTAKSLGTSTNDLFYMSNVQQLDYVEKYLKPYKGKMSNMYDLYFAIFFPVAIGKPDNYVLKTSNISASKIASQNPAYDINKDQQITVAEVKQAINKRIK